MSTHIITATEVSRSFSDILNKVHYQGDRYKIKKGKEIIAQIVPVTTKKVRLQVSELNEVFKKLPKLDDADQAVFEKEIQAIRENFN